MKQFYFPVQDYFPSLHIETVDPLMLSVLWMLTCNVCAVRHFYLFIFFSPLLCVTCKVCSVFESLSQQYTILLIIKVIIVLIKMCQRACIIPIQCFSSLLYGFGPGIYTSVAINTLSYTDFGDINRGVQEDQYFTVLTGPIFYVINQSMRLWTRLYFFRLVLRVHQDTCRCWSYICRQQIWLSKQYFRSQ